MKPPAVILLGEYDAAFPPHVATEAAAYTSATAVGGEVSARWLSTAEVSDRRLREASGLWVTPGSPYRDLRRTLNAIRYAREHSLPCLGTCGGFQHIVLEYARNVLGYVDAAHAEYDPYASSLFVSQLACSLAGRTMRLTFRRDSRVAAWYGSLTAEEQYYCNFGVNPERASVLASGALEIVGHDSEGEVRVVELPDHEFFVGTLYVPQMRSTPARPHPLISAFIRAVIRRQSEAA